MPFGLPVRVDGGTEVVFRAPLGGGQQFMVHIHQVVKGLVVHLTQKTHQEVLSASKAQSVPERGFRFLKSPAFLAASLYLKKPERIMALSMVMTVCLLVYAALESRLRQALRNHDETLPDRSSPFL
jgi:transposase